MTRLIADAREEKSRADDASSAVLSSSRSSSVCRSSARTRFLAIVACSVFSWPPTLVSLSRDCARRGAGGNGAGGKQRLNNADSRAAAAGGGSHGRAACAARARAACAVCARARARSARCTRLDVVKARGQRGEEARERALQAARGRARHGAFPRHALLRVHVLGKLAHEPRVAAAAATAAAAAAAARRKDGADGVARGDHGAVDALAVELHAINVGARLELQLGLGLRTDGHPARRRKDLLQRLGVVLLRLGVPVRVRRQQAPAARQRHKLDVPRAAAQGRGRHGEARAAPGAREGREAAAATRFQCANGKRGRPRTQRRQKLNGGHSAPPRE